MSLSRRALLRLAVAAPVAAIAAKIAAPAITAPPADLIRDWFDFPELATGGPVEHMPALIEEPAGVVVSSEFTTTLFANFAREWERSVLRVYDLPERLVRDHLDLGDAPLVARP